jgi:hypothetical protein
VSVQDRVVSELDFPDDLLEDRVVDWPGEVPDSALDRG